MRLFARMPSFAVTTVLLLGIAVIAWRFISSGENWDSVSLEVPEFSELASGGKTAFDANGAVCHGANGSGSWWFASSAHQSLSVAKGIPHAAANSACVINGPSDRAASSRINATRSLL